MLPKFVQTTYASLLRMRRYYDTLMTREHRIAAEKGILMHNILHNERCEFSTRKRRWWVIFRDIVGADRAENGNNIIMLSAYVSSLSTIAGALVA